MTNNEYQTVAKSTDIPLGKTLCVNVNGKEILLCHSNEGFYAVDNLCSHAEAKLSEGKLKGCRILCPLHGAAFDIRDGQALSKPASKSIKSYPLQVLEDQIQIQLGE
ncbi:non-heme iron oxygenase ferredoxin subunit [Oceanicoccus sp. KOV_DT_Chl]|uniref:Rieske (2Fe-2S) protein n=1 Tax=Oceanicoccus sp. KOV_DT_Chl TaxID=1904639 RepID=UPI000C7A8F00|nr:non-heme iron oxygenase ferredoxin subunit [Oceanicoccus sp. KOV_DT_Chl]